MKRNLPAWIVDMGSPASQHLDFSREKLWARMDSLMGRKAVELPVYLVNPRQMDLLYPPERLKFLDPEMVRNWARRERRRERLLLETEEEENPLRGLEEVGGERYGKYREVVAVGLYLKGPTSQWEWQRILSLADPSRPPDGEAQHPPAGPAILLCPERILDWASRAGVDPHLVLDKVYYHELGHALMDTGPTPYGELWGRIVEESLANWVAYHRFRGREARWVQKLISEQPAEYQGYAHLGEALRNHPVWEPVLERLPLHLHRLWLHFREEWAEWVRWARRQGLPLTPLLVWPVLPSNEETWNMWVYRTWVEIKGTHIDPAFWATYAQQLLLRAFS